MSNARDTVRELVDELPDGELKAAKRYLEYLCNQGDPLALAPIDDEPTTDEDRAAAREGWDDYQRGDFTTADELKRELGE